MHTTPPTGALLGGCNVGGSTPQSLNRYQVMVSACKGSMCARSSYGVDAQKIPLDVYWHWTALLEMNVTLLKLF
jgi:hypothetical protein